MGICQVLKLSLLLSLFVALKGIAQPRSTGINTPLPNAQAALEIQNTKGFNQGIIIPRMPSTIIATWTGLGAADQGLMFYGTGVDADSIFYWTGTKWLSIATNNALGKNVWSVVGNKIFYKTGNVGIGNSDPISLLDLYHISNETISVSDIVHIQQSTTSIPAAGFGGAISFSNQLRDGTMALSGRMSSILENAIPGSAAAGLLFQTRSSKAANMNNSLYISGDGNVGIGTTIPATSLEINGGLAFTPGAPRYYTIASIGTFPIYNESYIGLETDAISTTITNLENGLTVGQIVLFENRDESGSFIFLNNPNTKLGENVEIYPGQVLTLMWNGNSWVKIAGGSEKKIAFSASSNAIDQPMSNVPSKVNYEIENYDDGDNYDFSRSRFTVPPSGDGLYHFDASFTIAPGLSPDRPVLMSFYLNRLEIKNITGRTINDYFSLSLSCDIKLIEGDYIEVYIHQQANPSYLTRCASPCLNWFNGHRVY